MPDSASFLIIETIVIFILILISPIIARKLKLPVIITEVLLGILIGESLLKMVPEHPILDFLASFGLVYLMFLVGLEVDLEVIKRNISMGLPIASSSLIIPFISGFILALHIGVNPLILGTVFTTTSIGVILPLIRELELTELFKYVLLVSVAIVDIASIFILAFILGVIQNSIDIAFIYSFIAVTSLFIIPYLIRRCAKRDICSRFKSWINQESYFEIGVRISFVLIIALATISYQLGFHAIIGSFIAGLIMSELMPYPSKLRSKLEGFGYGFFIPIFFILTGSRVDIPILLSNIENLIHLAYVIAIAISSKVFSVFITSMFLGFKFKEALLLGLLHSARVSLILAVAEIGRSLNLIDLSTFSILVILSIVSTIIGPTLGRYILKR